ncbi:MAG: AMP-binding protein [Pararhodobacter sp.]
MNTAYLGAILVHVINNCAARVMVIEAGYLPRIADIADQLKVLVDIVVRGPMPEIELPARFRLHAFDSLPGAAHPVADVAPWEIMGIMYTSGTTGLSKGVRVSHAHAYGYSAPEIYGACSPDDTALVVLPMFHIGGQWKGVYNALIAGASAVILPRFHASRFWQDVRDYGCTYTLVLGVMGEFLYRQPPEPADRDHRLKRIAMVPVINDLAAFKARFGIETVNSAYGSTEASVVILTPPDGAEPGRIGWLRPDFEARLVDEHDMDVPFGSAGELLLRAREPWVMLEGYHDMPEATVGAFRNLWFHTGDTMRQDERGMFIFVDRSKDAIRRRGENVSSFEVEREIMAHPAVEECAVVAAPSDATEDDIRACIVLKPGATLDCADLIAFLRPRLPYFMLPRYVDLMPELPRTPTEKVRKQKLRQMPLATSTWDAVQAGVPLKETP